MIFRNSLKELKIFALRGLSSTASAAFLVLFLCLPLAQQASAQVPGSLDDSDLIEEQVEDEVEEDVEDQVDDSVTDAAEDQVEEAVEDRLDELLLGPGDRFVEEKVEEQIEDEVTDSVEDVVEDAVEEVAEEEVENSLEDAVEEQITDAVTEEVEDDVEQEVQDEVEETVADNVEDSVEDQIEESVQQEVAQNVEQNVEDNVESSVETSVQEDLEQSVESEVEASVEVAVEDNVEQSVESAAEVQVAAVVEERLENEIDDILDDLESELEVDEARIQREQWLVMAEPEVFEELAEKGYLFDTVTDLPGLGMRLAEVAGPSSFDITEVRRGVLDVVGKDRAEVDLNHIYTAGSEVAVAEQGIVPRSAITMPASADNDGVRIGMIDSKVDTSHPSLANASIESRSFVSAKATLPDFHGTAIASIIAANDGDYQGLLPGAEVYAAAVFEVDEERGEIASTVSLLRALDWLISTRVDVVNISLAGPPNRLLEAALQRASEQDVLVMAAAGNGGPVARPMYPAAYDTVVAVTAVDEGHRVFRLANRGDYLDIAAPGVGLLHARAGGGYVASSGTSFAVPFAATAAARLRKQQPGADVMALLYNSAEDLGPPGRDDIYGYGLLRIRES
ncbi:S8 family serine peptidase [Pseudohalioglobus sediminis]|uniref:S8 family serine peptidase n=1 Tax=Pseudohalioglobus sediminis TaxID=2606449 RepID=A0A5B0WZB4_9GAMM|nr:S8 family serine peptidase [Pseudohalioglobus sediminis]KAA1192402.1 S8 family serine peptidase [Pseudohalioglobus sediminis]